MNVIFFFFKSVKSDLKRTADGLINGTGALEINGHKPSTCPWFSSLSACLVQTQTRVWIQSGESPERDKKIKVYAKEQL